MVDGPQRRRPQAAHISQGIRRECASLSDGRIVYQLVSDLHLYDIAAGKDAKIEIRIPSDFDQMREKWLAKPLEYMTSAHLSPSGDKVALVSRGRVFVAPAGPGAAGPDRPKGWDPPPVGPVHAGRQIGRSSRMKAANGSSSVSWLTGPGRAIG